MQQVRRHIGMVYQYSALLSSRNVRDNVALPLEELTDKSREEIDKIVDEKTGPCRDERRETSDAVRIKRRDEKTREPGAGACPRAGIDPFSTNRWPVSTPVIRR